MTSRSDELARRAVASKHWRWMPGMLTTSGDRVHDASDAADGVLWLVYEDEAAQKPGCVEDFAPDLDDPATIGCLLALVREAYSDSTGRTNCRDDAWATYHFACSMADAWLWNAERSADFAAALVAALDAAP